MGQQESIDTIKRDCFSGIARLRIASKGDVQRQFRQSSLIAKQGALLNC